MDGQQHVVAPTQPLIVAASAFADDAPLWSKRVFDLIIAAILIVLLLPIGVVIASAIRVESRGPVFFYQRRGGLAHEPFNIIKFRTMTADAPDTHQAVANDPRVTRVGRILRQTSFDEWPQLLNVLKGEMSIVGPRPHPLWLDRKYDYLPGYQARYLVKPGMTGLAQINGLRGETNDQTMAARIETDLTYIRNYRLRGDFLILFKTVGCVAGQVLAARRAAVARRVG